MVSIKVRCPLVCLPHCLQCCWVPLSSLLSPLSSLPSLYRIISRLLVSCSTPQLRPHSPIQPHTAHRKIYSHFEELDTTDHGSEFQGIFCRSRCLVVYCELSAGWCSAVAIFTWLKLAVGWTSPNLSYQFMVKNGINTQHSVLQYIILKLKLNRR